MNGKANVSEACVFHLVVAVCSFGMLASLSLGL